MASGSAYLNHQVWQPIPYLSEEVLSGLHILPQPLSQTLRPVASDSNALVVIYFQIAPNP